MKWILTLVLLSLGHTALLAGTPKLRWADTSTDVVFQMPIRHLTDPGRNIYLFGTTGLGTNGDLSLSKYRYDGSLVWRRHLDSGSFDSPTDLGLDANGNIFIAGYGGDPNFVIAARYTPDGALVWKRSLAGRNGIDAYSTSAFVNPAGHMTILGRESTRTQFGVRLETFVVGWNADGVMDAPTYYGRFAPDLRGVLAGDQAWIGECQAVHADKDNNITQLISDDVSVRLQKTGSWNRDIPSGSLAYSIRTDRKGAVFLMGSAAADERSYTRIWKFDADGTPRWDSTFENIAALQDIAAVTRGGNLIMSAVDFDGISWIMGVTGRGKIGWKIRSSVALDLSTDSDGNLFVSGNNFIARYTGAR